MNLGADVFGWKSPECLVFSVTRLSVFDLAGMELSSPQTNEEGQTIEQHPNGVTGLAAENIPGRDVPGLSKVLTGFFSVLGATVGKNPAPTT